MTPAIRRALAYVPERAAVIGLAVILSLVTAGAQSNSAQSSQLPSRFETETRIVQVEVIVRGNDGQPVRGLTANDFKLFDNGTEQPVALFSVQSNQTAARATSLGHGSSSAPADRLFSNGAGDASGATVILLDRVNTPAQDQKFARDELLKFVQKIAPGDRVAIYVLGFGTVRVLHDFTGDPAVLGRALSRLEPRRNAPLAASAAPPTGVMPPETLSYDAVAQALAPLPATQSKNTGIVATGGAQAIAASNAENRVDTTAHALAAIASHLAGLPGRKNLVWVSAGFPIDFEGELVGSAPLRQAVEALNDANVAIYPVSARGLNADGVVAGADIPSPLSNARTGPALGQENGRDLMAASFAPDHIGSLQKLANDTGGQAFFNTNDLSAAVEHALDDGRVTYVLGFYPSHGQWDGRFRDIKVTVDRPGVDVRFRKGYIAGRRPIASPELREGELLALAGSALEATGLGLTARVDTPAGKNHAPGEISIAIQVAPASISLTKSDGWSGLLDLLIVQTATDGRMFKSFGGAIDFTLPDARRERFLREGLTVTQPVSVRPDAQSLTLMVRDVASGAIGSIIIDAGAIRNTTAAPMTTARPDLTAYAALVSAYRSGRPERAIAQLAAWPTRAIADDTRAAAQAFSASDRMAAAILSAEVVDVLAQRADVKPLIESALPLVQAAGAEPFGHVRGDDPRRSWYYVVAATLISAGRLNDASWVIRNGLMTFPRDPVLYFVRGTIGERALFRRSSDFSSVSSPSKMAIDNYILALDVDPHLAIANVHLARVRMAMDDWPRSRGPLEAAVADAQSDPVRYMAHLLLGRLEEHDTRLDRAKAEYEAAFAIGAGYQTACVALSRVEEALGHGDEARRVAAECPALSGHDDPWWSFAVQFDSDALTELRAAARLP